MALRLRGLKPGQLVPKSGQYQQIGPRGGKGPERTAVEGKRLPPTLRPRTTYTLVDETRTT